MTTSTRFTCSFVLNFREGTSDKFYAAELNGSTISINYGRAYSSGSFKKQTYPTYEAAAKDFFRLARDKMRKGYRISEAKVGDGESRLGLGRFVRAEYGSVQRERAEITLDLGGRMIDNLTLPEPDESLLFDSMFADGDAELVSALARSHPATTTNDVAGLGAWLSGAKASGPDMFAAVAV